MYITGRLRTWRRPGRLTVFFSLHIFNEDTAGFSLAHNNECLYLPFETRTYLEAVCATHNAVCQPQLVHICYQGTWKIEFSEVIWTLMLSLDPELFVLICHGTYSKKSEIRTCKTGG